MAGACRRHRPRAEGRRLQLQLFESADPGGGRWARRGARQHHAGQRRSARRAAGEALRHLGAARHRLLRRLCARRAEAAEDPGLPRLGHASRSRPSAPRCRRSKAKSGEALGKKLGNKLDGAPLQYTPISDRTAPALSGCAAAPRDRSSRSGAGSAARPAGSADCTSRQRRLRRRSGHGCGSRWYRRRSRPWLS